MPVAKRPKLTRSQQRYLREHSTAYCYGLEASAEAGGAPEVVMYGNLYHGAAAAIEDGAAHASTSHECETYLID